MVKINPQKLESYLRIAYLGMTTKSYPTIYEGQIKIDLKPGVSLILSRDTSRSVSPEYSAVLVQSYDTDEWVEDYPVQGYRKIPLKFNRSTLKRLYDLVSSRLELLGQTRKNEEQRSTKRERNRLETVLKEQLKDLI